MTDRLIVYMAGTTVGTITAVRPDALTFQYDPDWVAGGGLPLSSRAWGFRASFPSNSQD